MVVTSKNRNSGRMLRSVLLYGVGALTACSTIEFPPDPLEPPAFSIRYDEIFYERPAIARPQEIHQLTAQQEADFLDYYNRTHRQSIPTHERIYDYLEDITVGFSYHGNTNPAAKALELSEGNCLSLAILTTAIAKLTNVEVGYQLVDSVPVFEFNDDLVIKGVHIRTKLFESGWEPGESIAVFVRPGLVIDYFPSGSERFMHNLSEDDYIARYYLNLAADAIKEEDYSKAYWLTLEAIEFESLNSEAFNNLAVIYKRMGELTRAEEIYLYAIENLPNKLTLLKNYRILLAEQQRHREAKGLSKKITELDDPSPFHWFHAAREAYDDGDYREAIDFYERAVSIAPYLHEVRFGLAQSYYQVGRLSLAEGHLRAALENVYTQDTRSLYQAKLMVLSVERESR